MTAPFTGVVTQMYAYTGALLPAGTSSNVGQSALCRLSQNDLLRLVIPVPERYAGDIHLGQEIGVKVSALNKTFTGKVIRYSDQIDMSTRTMHTEVDVRNHDHVLVPGLYAEADLVLEHKEDIPTIPLQAVNHQGDKTSVFVVTANNQLEDRTVSLGIQTANDAEVVTGLHQGEMVVVSDRAGLKPGERVSPQIVQIMQYHDGTQE